MALDPIKVPDVETEEQKAERLKKEKEESERKAAEELAKKQAEEEEAKRKAEEEARLKAKENETDDKIIIDEVEYKLDENGNAVDESGEIKFTKEDIEKMSSNDDNTLDGDYIEEISKVTGTFKPTLIAAPLAPVVGTPAGPWKLLESKVQPVTFT